MPRLSAKLAGSHLFWPQLVRLRAMSSKGVNKIKITRSAGDDKPSSLVKLVDMLQSIDTTSKLAQLNATTISDNNGGRIIL